MSKTLTSCLIISILFVGIGYSSTLYVHSISAKKSSTDKTTALSSTTSSVSTNNNNNNNKTSVALDALELKNGTYRWQNTSQQINPTLRLIAHTDYLIKIKNPTDAKHELIIGSNGTEIAKSNSINPGKNKHFVFNANTTGVF
jgi:hypothetical protein